MADVEQPAPSADRPESRAQPGRRQAKSGTASQHIPLHKIYALPVPIRTFPLPTFYPSNPLSLLHVIWAWASRALFPPPPEIYQAYWSSETRSVHVRDPKSIRALWEQGFFGKGSYSRSEPNWLKREQNRQGQGDKKVSELVTVQRREERKMMKWDRARKEQEAILKTRLQEAWVAPVGPKELLALPNSLRDLQQSLLSELPNGHTTFSSSADLPLNAPSSDQTQPTSKAWVAPVGPQELLALPNSLRDLQPSPLSELSNGHTALSSSADVPVNGPGDEQTQPTSKTTTTPSTGERVTDGDDAPLDIVDDTLKQKKSVRFSPEVKSTTFQLFDPPTLHPTLPANGYTSNSASTNGTLPPSRNSVATEGSDVPVSTKAPAVPLKITDREHLQLSPEEAFYLVFALGVISVADPATGNTLTSRELFEILCGLSSTPGSAPGLRPDNAFLVQYAVYHHFRSLGWVPRSGIKFGVDWLLYLGGPVFSHAEFAVVVVPAYTDPYWKSHGRPEAERSWHWLHSINRVQAHALKSLILVYVDIPPPAEGLEPAALLKRYKIREFFMRRWLSNRSR
ncbi:hypothetical protein GGR50DRAFT_619904 [Xylaria sp. CBS 124048]|nr:hypothetical protein GGR50DRAFT_619904 [Xylaria sp. CBS 124048]